MHPPKFTGVGQRVIPGYGADGADGIAQRGGAVDASVGTPVFVEPLVVQNVKVDAAVGAEFQITVDGPFAKHVAEEAVLRLGVVGFGG